MIGNKGMRDEEQMLGAVWTKWLDAVDRRESAAGREHPESYDRAVRDAYLAVVNMESRIAQGIMA